MKIGIDAKWFFTGHISGKLFIQNILPELFALYPEIEWHVFLNKKDKNFDFAFKQENITLHYVWAGFNMLSNLFILPKYARRLKLDAVLFQTFSPKGRKFKSLAFIHDVLFRDHPEYFTKKENLYFKPMKWTARKANRIITTTEFVKKELIRFHYVTNNQPIDIVPLGVTNIFKPIAHHDQFFLNQIKNQFKLPDSYLLSAGRLNARKNIQGLLKTLPLLNDKKISLVIAGDKDRNPPHLNHLLTSEIIKRVIFTGPVSDNELAAIYAMGKIFCFPSFAEGFGLPPLEAMASGIPAIVSNTSSMPEVCGSAAIYIDPHNSNDIAEKINTLLENNFMYEQKVHEGLKWSDQYSWQKTAKGIMKSIFASLET